jgi:hypothetical protein
MNKRMQINYFLEINKTDYVNLTKLLLGEQDFTPINPYSDGCFYHKDTLNKFLNGSLEFDEKPSKNELFEVNHILSLMNNQNTNFLYLK